MKNILLATVLVLATGVAGAQPLVVVQNVRLPKDPTLITSLQGWLDQRSKPDSTNAYLSQAELPATSLLMDELRDVDAYVRRDSGATCRCYLGNVAPLDSDRCLVQLNYTEMRRDTPVVLACCTVLAQRAGDKWMVSSVLGQNTVGWKTRVVGNCTFHYATAINERKAAAFVRQVASYDKRLGAGDVAIDYYCCNNAVEATRLFGLDYVMENNGEAFNDYTADHGRRSVVVNGDRMKDGFNDWDTHDYWHGRLHRVVPVPTINRPVDEGMAYLYGGSWRVYSWEDVLRLFRDYAAAHPDADWLALYKGGTAYVTGPTPLYVAYVINSLIVRQLEKEKGFAAALPLLTCGRRQKGDANYFAALKNVVGVDEAGFNGYVAGLVAGGHNYYVARDGDDGADGSKMRPWKSLAVIRTRIGAGDSVFLHGGQVFEGTLRIDSGARNVYIGSYDGGKATIRSGDSSGAIVYGALGMTLRGLVLVGAGRKTGNVKDGLTLIECRRISVKDIEITGYQKSGLFVYACVGVEARRVYAHANGAAGIAVEGPFDSKRHARDLRFIDCRTDDNPGDPTNLTNHSGNGIVVGHCTNVLIDHCSATNNGWDMPRIGNGPVGIWCYEADSVTIQNCLAYQNKTSPGAADGGGFDLDGGVTNSVIQHCLSYGNQGAGYCIFQYWLASPWHDNIIRDNISENDGWVTDGRGGIYVWNSSGDSNQFYGCKVYGNTVYNTREAAVSYSEKSARKQFSFYNNTFVGGDSLIRGDRGVDRFYRNRWWQLHGDGRRKADSAEGGKAVYVRPKQLPAASGMKGYGADL